MDCLFWDPCVFQLSHYKNEKNSAHSLKSTIAGRGINEAIEACERLLAGEVSEKRRATSTAVLCFLYDSIGETEKAEMFARNRPHIHESRELLLPNFLKHSEREAYLREHLPRILTDICNLIDGSTDTVTEKLRQIKLGMYYSHSAPK